MYFLVYCYFVRFGHFNIPTQKNVKTIKCIPTRAHSIDRNKCSKMCNSPYFHLGFITNKWNSYYLPNEFFFQKYTLTCFFEICWHIPYEII